MVLGTAELADLHELEADVCVVGAGPTGIAIAGALAGSDLQVVVAESGGRSPTRSSGRRVGGRSVGAVNPKTTTTTVAAFGGNAHLWDVAGRNAHLRPLDRIDFERRPDVPGSGWPFERAELVPFYERAAALFGLRPFDFDAEAADVDAASTLPLDPGRFVLGELQCGALSLDREYQRLAGASNVRLLLDAHVTELVPDTTGAGDIGGVRLVTIDGRSIAVQARRTVLAAGALGNPRLLLVGNRDHPNGIGNEHDLVGRFLMEHFAFRSGFVVPAGPRLLEAADLVQESQRDGVLRRPTVAPSEELLRAHGLLNTYLLLERRPRAFATDAMRSLGALARRARSRPLDRGLVRDAVNAVAHAPAVVRGIRALRSAERRPDDVIVLRIQAEQAPNPESRVRLAGERDQLGVRRVAIDWRYRAGDLASIRRCQELFGQELRAAELGTLRDLLGDERPRQFVGVYHHYIGTTRMHEDPREGVVDASCRVHSAPSVYVTGASVLPTCGAASPTLTAVALGLRLADDLRRQLA